MSAIEIAVLCSFAVIAAITLYVLARIARPLMSNRADLHFVAILVLFAVGIRVVIFFSERMGLIGEIIGAPILLIRDILPVLLALWLVWRVRPTDVSAVPDNLPIRDAVHRLFRSEEFLSALNTSLPRGKTDAEWGLDYIPFMLQSVHARRVRFERRANVFFWTTIVTGVGFAAIVAYLGYILVNEAAIGAPKHLIELRNEWNRTAILLDRLRTDATRSDALRDDAGGEERALVALVLNPKNSDLQSQISKQYNSIVSPADIKQLMTDITASYDNIDQTDRNAREFRHALGELNDSLERFVLLREGAIPELARAAQTINGLMTSIENELGKTDNRTAELIKRISVGLIVTTFLLAILRYVANQFRVNWEQAVRADEEDLSLRRFYVAIRVAAGNQADRSAVIASLVRPIGAPQPSSDGADFDVGKIDSSLLKEVLSAVSKKL